MGAGRGGIGRVLDGRIVVEDVHWIDRTSEEFLATLVGQLVAARILLIATYRPGYRAPWMERSYVTQVTIGPLSTGESAALLGSVAGDQPFATEVSTAILQRGEGNPFFLEELIAAAGHRTDDLDDLLHDHMLEELIASESAAPAAADAVDATADAGTAATVAAEADAAAAAAVGQDALLAA